MKSLKKYKKKIKEHKLLFATLLMTTFLVAGISAYYILSITLSSGLIIQAGQSELVISVPFDGETMDPTISLVTSDDLEITNSNGELTMEYILDISGLEDVDPTNCNSLGDLEFAFWELQNNSEIVNGTEFVIPEGVSSYEMIVTAINPKVCPRNGSLEINLIDKSI